MKRRFVVSIVLCLFMYVPLPAQTWQFTSGPNRPHEAFDIAIGKTGSTQKIYATDVDTLKLSVDAGSTWSSTGASTFLAPVVVTCNSTNPDIAVVAKFHQGNPSTNAIFRTVDGGGSWSNVTPSASLDFQPQRIAISQGNSDLAFLGTERTLNDAQTTLWRSATGAAAWSAVNYFRDTAKTFINDILPHPEAAYSNYIFVGGSTKDLVDDPEMSEQVSTERTKGVWRSTNSGVNWQFKAGFSTSDLNITALAMSIQGNYQLLAATSNSSGSSVNIYQSVDYGDTWSILSVPSGVTQIRSMKVSPANPQLILAGTDNGVLFSTDRGGSWNVQNTGLPVAAYNIHAVAFDLADATGNTAYIATGTSVYKGVYSAGSWSWTHKPTGSNYLNTSSLSAYNGTVFAVGSGWSGISKLSADVWSTSTSIKKFRGYSVSTSPSYSSYVYAGGSLISKGVIYRTANGGAAWTKEETVSSNPTYVSNVLADPKANSQYAFAGLSGSGVGSYNFRRSDDLGNNWSSVLVGSSTNPINALAIDASTGTTYSTTMYAGLGATRGVFKSTTAGLGFQFAALNTYDITAVALNSSTAALSDTIYVGGTAKIWKSTNELGGGDPPELTNPGFTGAKRILMHPSYSNSARHVWVIPYDGQKIFKTVNGGTNWTEVSTSAVPKPINDLASDAANDSLIYVGTSAGVYKVNPAPETPTGVTGTIVGGNPGLARIDWTSNLEADLMHYEVWRYFQTCNEYCPSIKQCGAPTSEAIRGTTTSTTYTDNEPVLTCGGWGTVIGVVGYYVKAVDKKNNVSGSSSSILFRRGNNDPEEKIWIDPDEIPASFFLSTNYPNPFNPVTTIKYGLPEDAKVKLVVIDLLGREVAILVNEAQTAGYKSVVFDVSRFASGVYLYRLVAGTFTNVKKMIVTK